MALLTAQQETERVEDLLKVQRAINDQYKAQVRGPLGCPGLCRARSQGRVWAQLDAASSRSSEDVRVLQKKLKVCPCIHVAQRCPPPSPTHWVTPAGRGARL